MRLLQNSHDVPASTRNLCESYKEFEAFGRVGALRAQNFKACILIHGFLGVPAPEGNRTIPRMDVLDSLATSPAA